VLLLRLSGHGRDVPLVYRGLLCGPRACRNATGATVIADAIHCGVVDHRRVVNIVNVGDVHVVHRTVVVKLSVLPTAALIALTKVSVAITNSAVEAYLRTPIAFIENVSVAAPTPIGWSPEIAGFGRHHPRTRHPVIIVVIISVCPVPGCPQIALAGTERLLVDGEFWRGE